MAAGTRGRSLQDGAKFIRIHGRDVKVKAAIETVSGLSGHADRRELLRWSAALSPPKATFLTHGEPASLAALAETLRGTRRWNVVIPRLHQTIALDDIAMDAGAPDDGSARPTPSPMDTQT
jgi:metallo-beta-lactamase family protein